MAPVTLPTTPFHMPVSRDFGPLPSDAELRALYPANLDLINVQVLFRHGERTPVRARFQTWGLQPFWPFCKIAQQFSQTIVTFPNGAAMPFEYVRRLESVARELPFNVPVPASGFTPGEHDGLCMLGELTDLGRATGYTLGERLRWLYVDKLRFIPPLFDDHAPFYFRSSHVARSNETLLSLLHGLYPTTYRDPELKPVIYTRLFPQENAYPNDENCKRLSELGFMFSEVVANRWNPVLAGYTSSKLTDVLPNGVAIDGSPRASGIFDTVAACAAHGVDVPAGFKDKVVVDTLRDAVIDEWYLGVKSSNEYRKLAVGALVGDFMHRINLAVAADKKRSTTPFAGSPFTEMLAKHAADRKTTPEKAVKMALYGSHDTTIASILCALNAFDSKWPPFTSDLTIELFAAPALHEGPDPSFAVAAPPQALAAVTTSTPSTPTAITPVPTQHRNYYVRLRYNDEPLTLPGCASTDADHLPGNPTFCTLDAFSRVVAEFVPQNWERACRTNLGKPILDAPVIAKEFASLPLKDDVVMQKAQA
ncbi:histidine phosphatase superfamily [Limtongia smithiae]|uniref:histidine phosphatase superfamily n=1 Tax=Limtongia smithiae TaxID=1125753 RepID=UPI0034CEDE37